MSTSPVGANNAIEYIEATCLSVLLVRLRLTPFLCGSWFSCTLRGYNCNFYKGPAYVVNLRRHLAQLSVAI